MKARSWYMKAANMNGFPSVLERFLTLLFSSRPTAHDGLRGPKDRPQSTEEASRMAPRRPKGPPRRSHEGPKTA
eukprot:7598105-Pyramimonas_sp.AAC.1